jgi:hypothetical protein
MKNRYLASARFIFVIHLATYLTGCRTIESCRPYDPDLDSDAVTHTESITLKDGKVINLDEYSNVKIIKDAKSGKALSFELYDTVWDNSRKNFTLTTTADTISFDKISKIRINEANTGGTVALVIGGILVVLLVLFAIGMSQTDFGDTLGEF